MPTPPSMSHSASYSQLPWFEQIRRGALASVFWSRASLSIGIIGTWCYGQLTGRANGDSALLLLPAIAAWLGVGYLVKRGSLASIVITAVVNLFIIVVPLLTLPSGRLPHGAEALLLPILPAALELVALAIATVAAMVISWQSASSSADGSSDAS